MQVLVLGDSHGQGQWLRDKIYWAKKRKIKKVIQVGDFGLWDHEEDGVRFLDWTNEALRETGIQLTFLGGNHENWDHLNWYEQNWPKSDNGHIHIRSHIRYTGRSSRWNWGGKTFQAVGGAVSIDKAWRTVGKSMWLDEEIPDRVVNGLEAVGAKSDYLFTHDAPSCVPMANLKPDMDSALHRQKMDRIGRAVRPDAWFHGHYHKWMEYSFMHQEGYTAVYGLDRDYQFWSHVILDTETNEVIAANGKSNFV